MKLCHNRTPKDTLNSGCQISVNPQLDDISPSPYPRMDLSYAFDVYHDNEQKHISAPALHLTKTPNAPSDCSGSVLVSDVAYFTSESGVCLPHRHSAPK